MSGIQRVVIVDSPQIAERGEVLFPGAVTLYANGSVPAEALQYPDAVVVSTDRQRIDSLCAALVAAQCPKVREWEQDISEFTERQQVIDSAGKIKPYVPSSAPEAATAAGSPPILAEAPPEAEHFDELDEDEAAERAMHSIRIASNIVHLRAVDAKSEWPDPEEEFSDAYTLPEFSPEWIPPPLRDFVVNVHKMQGCDLGIPAMHALTVAAGLISDDIKVSVKRQQEWYESARLWSCVLGRSGDGKSPALRAVMRETKALSIEIAEASKRRMAEYRLEMEVYETRRKRYVAEKANDKVVGLPPIPPDRPVDEQLYFDDTNTEGIADVLQQSSRGSMLINDELLGWLSGFDRYRPGGDRQFYLETWDGGERVFNRVGRKWIIKACGLSICGNSQPAAIQKAVAKMGLENDGLIQRVLIYNSLREADSGSEAAADRDAIARWRRISHSLYHMKTHLEHCYFSPTAQAIYKQAEAWVADVRSAATSEAAQEHISKYRGYLARIALTMHCIDCADQGREAVAPEIHQDTIARAFALIRDCLHPHALKFYGEIAGDTSRKRALRQITNYIICRPDPQTLILRRRDLERQCREAWYPEPVALREAARREMLTELIGMGWIRPLGNAEKIGKLPAEFAINPALDAKFASVRAVELPKREALYARMMAQKEAKRERQAGED
jgi:hypothetical protein